MMLLRSTYAMRQGHNNLEKVFSPSIYGQTFTNDGFESHFAINYLANFLLALLLLPSMDKEKGRIVFASSWTHDPAHPMNAFIKEEGHKTILTDPFDLANPKKADEKGDEFVAHSSRRERCRRELHRIPYSHQWD